MRILGYLEDHVKIPLWILGVTTFAPLAGLNLYVPIQLIFWPLYIVPLALFAWSSVPFIGYAAVCACVALSAIREASAGLGGGLPVIVWNIAIESALLISFVFLMRQLKEEWDQEKELTRIDSLTGVSNRKAFYDIADFEIHRSQRYHHPFTVAYVDIDNFKIVNYRFGHGAGDSLLHVIAQAMKSHLRNVDVVARFGGDEFALLLPETGAESAQIVISRLRTHMLDLMKKNEWPATFSFGVVTFMSPPSSVEEVIRKATVQMYAAKSSGANVIDQEVITKS